MYMHEPNGEKGGGGIQVLMINQVHLLVSWSCPQHNWGLCHACSAII